MPDIMDFPVMHHAKCVLPVPLQILEQVLGQQRVLLVPLARIPYLRTLLHVRSVTPLSTPTLSNARIRPIRKLQRAVKDITGPQVIHLVKGVMPATLQILEQTLGQPLVHLVLLAPSQILEQILVQLLVFHVLLAFIPQVLLLIHVQHAVLGISLRSSSKCHAPRAHLANGKTWKVNPHAKIALPGKFQNEPNKQAMGHAKIVVSKRTLLG